MGSSDKGLTAFTCCCRPCNSRSSKALASATVNGGTLCVDLHFPFPFLLAPLHSRHVTGEVGIPLLRLLEDALAHQICTEGLGRLQSCAVRLSFGARTVHEFADQKGFVDFTILTCQEQFCQEMFCTPLCFARRCLSKWFHFGAMAVDSGSSTAAFRLFVTSEISFLPFPKNVWLRRRRRFLVFHLFFVFRVGSMCSVCSAGAASSTAWTFLLAPRVRLGTMSKTPKA